MSQHIRQNFSFEASDSSGFDFLFSTIQKIENYFEEIRFRIRHLPIVESRQVFAQLPFEGDDLKSSFHLQRPKHIISQFINTWWLTLESWKSNFQNEIFAKILVSDCDRTIWKNCRLKALKRLQSQINTNDYYVTLNWQLIT